MILNGKIVATQISAQLKEEVEASNKRPPCLVIISVGDDPASAVYVRNKIKACEEIGINVTHRTFSSEALAGPIIRTIAVYNANPEVDGIMVQLPLPNHLDERIIIDTINPGKDVDGLTTLNAGLLRTGQLDSCFIPCTAKGVMDLLRYYNVPICGADVAIVGRSNIVGKPLADLMMAAGATVTQCHSKTQHLDYQLHGMDIVVSAVGKPKFITKDMVSIHNTTVIVDVGINRDENGKLCGDVDYENVAPIAKSITPVPGGIGPMTVAELMGNVVQAWRHNVMNPA